MKQNPNPREEERGERERGEGLSTKPKNSIESLWHQFALCFPEGTTVLSTKITSEILPTVYIWSPFDLFWVDRINVLSYLKVMTSLFSCYKIQNFHENVDISGD